MAELLFQLVTDFAFSMSPRRVQLAILHFLLGCVVAAAIAIVVAPHLHSSREIRGCAVGALIAYLIGVFFLARHSRNRARKKGS
jgi:hypothetical protein